MPEALSLWQQLAILATIVVGYYLGRGVLSFARFVVVMLRGQLTLCPACCQYASKRAAACPHCGEPLRAAAKPPAASPAPRPRVPLR